MIFMKDFEVLVERINPCGGSDHSSRELREVQADSPEAYVHADCPWPIIDQSADAHGNPVITASDGRGYLVRYTFTD